MDRIHTYDENDINFHNVDVHVSKVNQINMTSVSKLIEFFNVPIVGDKYKEIFLVREFLVWMSFMKTKGIEGVSEDIENLLGDTAANALESFCKSADVQAELIFGVGKNLNYIPGHTEEDEGSITKTAWVAFESNDRWHLVNPSLFLNGVTGYQRGGEIILESHGETVLTEERESKGIKIVCANDFWCCLHPSIFINIHLPDDPKWQLLPLEQRKSMSDYLSCSCLYQYFFLAKLQLLSEQTCVLHTKNGRCTITFGADKFNARYISMSYKLSLRSDTGSLKDIDVNDLPLLVRYAPGIGTFSFNIRFPVSGEYFFETYVSAPDIDGLNNFSLFKIICTDPDPACKKLPMDAGIVGYGFGYKAVDFGLKNPSEALRNITMKDKNTTDDVVVKEITFQIEDDKISDVEFSSDVVGEENEDNVGTETYVDEVKGKLHVKATMKTEGDYALSIIAREKDSGPLYQRVVNYLLTTKSYEEDNDFQHLSEKRKRELTLQAKLQKLNYQKTDVEERIKAVQTEIDDLQKRCLIKTTTESRDCGNGSQTSLLVGPVTESDKGMPIMAGKGTQSVEFQADPGSSETGNEQTLHVNDRNIVASASDDKGMPKMTGKETQSVEFQADPGSSETGNEQALHVNDRNIVASASGGEQVPGTKIETQNPSKDSKSCTVL